jgi:hypothetical protein
MNSKQAKEFLVQQATEQGTLKKLSLSPRLRGSIVTLIQM